MESVLLSNLRRLFPVSEEKGRALVAVSGGIDSMCLAAAVLQAGIPFDVAHCNFSLRGEESDADESLVCSWCFANYVLCHVARFDTMAVARQKGISIEMAARELRYNWFASLCKEKGYSAVLVAHNANDNAETMLLNLVRGTGIRGICGMSEVSTQVIDGQTLTIIRPFLDVSRDMIKEFVTVNAVPYREDATNADVTYKRNRIRHRVLPELEQMNSSVLKTLAADMAHFRDVAAVADSYYSAFMKSDGVEVLDDGSVRVQIASLLGNEHWKYLVFRLMEPYGFTSSDIDDVVDMLASGGAVSGKRFCGRDMSAYFTSTELVISEAVPAWKAVDVTGPGVFKCGNFTVEAALVGASTANFKEGGCVYLDAAKIDFPLRLRPWKAGDWMSPLGMGGRKRKLSDIFVSLKIAAPEKPSQVLVEFPSEEGRIAAIIGPGKIDWELSLNVASTKAIRLKILGYEAGAED